MKSISETTASATASATTFTVAFNGDNWSFWRDGEVPDDWAVWALGLTWEEAHLTWEEAHDAVSSVSTLTHAVTGPDGDVGLFSDATTATAFARPGETVSTLETPVFRADCRPVDGTDGFGVW
jgi:hypothetical protein